jgi:hypothetical protein
MTNEFLLRGRALPWAGGDDRTEMAAPVATSLADPGGEGGRGAVISPGHPGKAATDESSRQEEGR